LSQFELEGGQAQIYFQRSCRLSGSSNHEHIASAKVFGCNALSPSQAGRNLMALWRVLLVCLAIAIGFSAHAPCEAAEPVTLRVALYPYVPGKYSVFALLAREFQRRNKGVTLELVEVPPDQEYYSGGLVALDAHVFEIDSILLSDMLPKLAPLSLSLAEFSPESVEAVTRNGITYALPHWLCGNFLFYRRGNIAIRDAATWADLTKELARQNLPLLIDMFGRLTLGELYITLLADRVGVTSAEAAVIASDVPDPTVVADLNSILSGCPAGFCRSKDLHDRTGYYARAFLRGEAGAYVGYSESLHYALKEAMDNCRMGSSCISPNDIAVRRLPKLSTTSKAEGIGWVDGLAISATLTDIERDAALKFIEFATSADAYQLVLQPDWMEAPRYLLPARTGLMFSKETPLYPDLLSMHVGRKTGTAPGLNAKLQSLATKLNCALPIDRTDARTLDRCKTP
jgi:thiamine pyridinylase